MALKPMSLVLNMTGDGSRSYTIPEGYKFVTVYNNTDNTVIGYMGSDENGRLIFNWGLYTGQTVPIPEGREVFFKWTNGDSIQTPKPCPIVFSEENLGVSNTFGSTTNNNVNLSVDSVGIAKDGTLKDGTQKTQVTNFPASQVVSGNVGVNNFPANQTVSGSVSVSNFPASQTVAGTVGVNNFPANQTVNGTVTSQQGSLSALNLTAATVVKGSSGRVVRVNVIVAGTAPGTVNDTTTTGGAAAANEIFSIPNTVGSYLLDFPCANGIVVVPGTGQTVALSYS